MGSQHSNRRLRSFKHRDRSPQLLPRDLDIPRGGLQALVPEHLPHGLDTYTVIHGIPSTLGLAHGLSLATISPVVDGGG
jgi:hypothetical protein